MSDPEPEPKPEQINYQIQLYTGYLSLKTLKALHADLARYAGNEADFQALCKALESRQAHEAPQAPETPPS